MLTIEPTGAVLGATVRGVDFAQPLNRGALPGGNDAALSVPYTYN